MRGLESRDLVGVRADVRRRLADFLISVLFDPRVHYRSDAEGSDYFEAAEAGAV
jgi:hypothetical protein